MKRLIASIAFQYTTLYDFCHQFTDEYSLSNCYLQTVLNFDTYMYMPQKIVDGG